MLGGSSAIGQEPVLPAQPPNNGQIPEQIEATPTNSVQLNVLGPASSQGQDPSGPAGSRVVDSEEYKKLLEELMGDLLPGDQLFAVAESTVGRARRQRKR